MSKMIGSTVINDKNERIGTVDDVIADKDKKQLSFAVLQVGGFLGLGGRLVAVPYDSLVIDDTGQKDHPARRVEGRVKDVTRDMRPLSVAILSLLGGLVVGRAAVLLVRRRMRRERMRGFEKLSEAHGLLIWVRVRSPEKEAQAQEILMRHGGGVVHVHEIDATKRTEDLPLHSLRVDPWLGDERLRQP